MEMIVKCPDCGKDLKITIEGAEQIASRVLVRHLQESEGTWADIAELIHANAELYYTVGDEIACTLKDGTEVVFAVAAISPYAENEVAFVLKDCLSKRHSMVDMRKYLNGEIFDLLPDDLQKVIKKRSIKQRIDGKIEEYEDKLWLLSKMEVTGDAAEADVDDVHFELFADERSRVKQIDGETVWYWLRSPYTGSGNIFYDVSNGGGSNLGSAGNSFGVAFGFLI